MNLREALHWRYAVKLFDRTRTLSTEQIEELAEVVRMAPTSLGLQPFRLLIVDDPAVKAQLDTACHRQQKQPGSASHVFIFAAPTAVDEPFWREYVDRAARERHLPPEKRGEFETRVRNYITSKSEAELPHWVEKQVYLAAGQLLLAAALAGIDACPMEGFDRNEADRILGLRQMGLRSVLLCPLGHRSPMDTFAAVKKVRLPRDRFVIAP